MKVLTKEEALKRVELIELIKDDDEQAHTEEDALRDYFIECCSKGAYTKEEVIDISSIVLSSNKINFSRWCA